MKQLFVRTSPALAGLALGLAMLAPSRPAQACGGFFCATQPVIQTREGIIFAVDEAANTVEATINIAYQGNAADFAWVLPLQSNPEVSVGPSWAFTTIDRLTAPQFNITQVEQVGVCGPTALGRSANADASPPAAPGGAESQNGGVNVLQQGQTGPYMRVVLEGDPAKVKKWLQDNDYRVTDEMMNVVTPYITKGDVLLALKLRKDSDVGDIQPIKVKMAGNEACIPIRLTAIAAQDDMDIMAFVLTKREKGRAIPENFYHVTPNLARIDWLQRGSNYRQVVAAAADEGEGNAFTTEYAGPSSIFRDQIFRQGQYDLASLRAARTLDAFLQEVGRQGLWQRRETAGILARNISDDQLASGGISRQQFTQCPQCWTGSLRNVQYDPTAAANEIDERIVKPEREAQETFDKFDYATRLYTLISPEEMNVDPIFSYRTNLPDVSNVHNAKMILDCGVGGSPGSAGVKIVLEEEDTTISFDSTGNPDRTLLDQMPAAVRIEQLAKGTVLRDNAPAITTLLDEHNALSSGCGCASSHKTRTGASLGALALLGVALLSRRRR